MLNFISCVLLLKEMCKLGIIDRDPSVPGNILIYRDTGKPPEDYPEGWYSENLMTMASELTDDKEGQTYLLNRFQEVSGYPFITSIRKGGLHGI